MYAPVPDSIPKEGAVHAQPISAQELNAFLNALTESFHHLNLGCVRRGQVFAVPTGWEPEGLTVACFVGGGFAASGFLALDVGPRLAARIARYLTPKRTPLTDNDTRAALQWIGEEVAANMQTRLVRAGIMVQITPPRIHSPGEWKRLHPTVVPVGIVPLYSTCGICRLAFNLSC